MESPEDETEEAEVKPLAVKKGVPHKYDNKEVNLQKMEENESEGRGDMMASEEIVEGKALEKETEVRGQTSPHKGTLSELLRSHTPASNSPSAVPRLEVTLHKLQTPQPHYYRLTISPRITAHH